LPVKIGTRFDRSVDSRSLRWIVRIVSANDDPGVLIALPVQPNEVPAIDRQYGSILIDCKLENLVIGRALIGSAPLLNRGDVMPEPAQFFHNGKWKILVGIELSHCYSSSFSRICCSISSRWPSA
jgi:hypothetical protein